MVCFAYGSGVFFSYRAFRVPGNIRIFSRSPYDLSQFVQGVYALIDFLVSDCGYHREAW
jgi:hypothetical protein